MLRPASRAYVAGCFAALAVAVGLVSGIVQRITVTQVKPRVTVIQHRQTVVTMPCVAGNSHACRAFISALLSDATRQELRTLLGAESIRIPRHGLPRLVGQLHRLLRPHRRHHRARGHRPGVPRPPSPFSPIPPSPPAPPLRPVPAPAQAAPPSTPASQAQGTQGNGNGNGGVGQGRGNGNGKHERTPQAQSVGTLTTAPPFVPPGHQPGHGHGNGH